MKKLLLLLLLFVSVTSIAQNLTETVSYINTLFKSSSYIMKLGGVPIYSDLYDKITVDEHGKMDCTRYMTDGKTGETKSIFQFFVYLKSLQSGHKKDYEQYYITTLDCVGLEYCFGGIDIERTDVYFSITTASNRDKLHNAFSHLIELAKNNKDFYNKDPFQK